MGDLAGNADDLHALLGRTLTRIEAEVGRLLDGSPDDLLDRDRLLETLDEQADDLCRALEVVGRYCDEAETREPVDLNSMAEEALARQLDAVAFPVVVRTAWSPEAPTLRIARSSVRSLLDQVVRLTLRFAGNGGSARFSTSCTDMRARFSVEATTGEGHEVDPEGFSLRFESVTEFVERFGGASEIDVGAPGRLSLELCLPLGASVA